MKEVAALFVRSDSVYKSLDGIDVYDIDRDARTFDKRKPVIAHPPCRGWGRLRGLANPRPDERNLARLAVSLVRENGGVLEQPAFSTLWKLQKMPYPGESQDMFGGWTLEIKQQDFGHKAEKSTWLYIVGCKIDDIPALPQRKYERATHVITQSLKKGHPNWRPRVTNAEREHTPINLAKWLFELAQKCSV